MELLNAKETIGRLRMGKVADIGRSYFSKLVKDGYIPYRKAKGRRRKLFVYDEVKQALLDMQDPSRDAQREANEKRRQGNRLEKALMGIVEYSQWIASHPLTVEQFVIQDHDITLKELQQELCEINAQNLLIKDLIMDYADGPMEMIGKHSSGAGVKYRWVYYFYEMIMDREKTANFLGVELIENSDQNGHLNGHPEKP